MSFVPNHASDVILQLVSIIWLILDVFFGFLFLDIESILLDDINVSTHAFSYLYSNYQNRYKKFLLGDNNKCDSNLTQSYLKDNA